MRGKLKLFFDEIDHNILMEEVEKLIKDPSILQLIRLWLTTEVNDDGVCLPTTRGVPQGALCKALHKAPYAKPVTMQRRMHKAL